MSYKITLIPGDGIGPELTEATVRVLEASGVDFQWDVQQAGIDVMAECGTPLPETVLESIRRNKVALKGPITTPVGKGFRSVNVALRKSLNLYSCVRPCKSYDGVPVTFRNVDIVIFRENMEDLYAGIEFELGKAETLELITDIERLNGNKILFDSGITIKPISITNSNKILRAAFEYAVKNNRRKVTAVHKANIMKYTDGLFLHLAAEMALQYPQIEFEDRIVDNMCMQLVKDPTQFDVIVLPNLYGDILSDLCAGLVGGLGVAPGANIGDEYAVFEPTHGSAPKYKGMNKANPMAQMLSGVMMLRHLGEYEAANLVEKAMAEVIAEGKYVSYDLLPLNDRARAVGTAEVATAIIERMQNA
ncbi:MAG: isocitrate/isopropylmalate dehydrogenase family protein [Chloroflexi bacterium]|nr:isocitrate/isopropylmalate dehydrogenase family protein [Chloroflexota bacterium]